MSVLFRTLLALMLTVAAISPATAQPSSADDETVQMPAERTIDIDAPLSIEGDLIGPNGDLVDVSGAPSAESLVPNRASFVDFLIESADEI